MPPLPTERWKPSVTVAAVIEREGRYLLVEEHTADGMMLNNPAGHLECGESPVEGVRREALEETTCTFTPDTVVGMYLSRAVRDATGEDITYLRIAFSGSVGDPDPQRQLDDGIVRTLWLTVDEVRAARARHRSPMVMQCIDDHRAGTRYPLALVTSDASLREPLHK